MAADDERHGAAHDDERHGAAHDDDDAVTPPGTAPSADRVLETAVAFWQSAVLVTAHELGLFAALGAGPCDAATLEGLLDLRAGACAELLDALLMLGLVERSDGQYRNALEARLFLVPTSPSSVGHWLAMASAAMRELADLTARLRALSTAEESTSAAAPLSPSEQLWTDIGALLRKARDQDGS